MTTKLTGAVWSMVEVELKGTSAHEFWATSPAQCFRLYKNGSEAASRDVLSAWGDCPAFQSFFLDVLAKSNLSSFSFESAAISAGTFSSPFDFYLREAKCIKPTFIGKSIRREWWTWQNCIDGFSCFSVENDGIVFSPLKMEGDSIVANFSDWLRDTPNDYKTTLWQSVGQTLSAMLCARPIWLTAVSTEDGLQISISGTTLHCGTRLPLWNKADFELEYNGRGRYVNCHSVGRTYVKPQHPDAVPWGGMR